MEGRTVEDERLDIERERLDIEKARFAASNRFVNRHLGVLVTTAVSFAAVVVSFSQIWVASIDKDKELALARVQSEREHETQIRELERRWKLDLAAFVTKNSEKIFTGDKQERRRIKDVLVVSFPPEITNVLFRQLHSRESGDAVWAEGQTATGDLLAAAYGDYLEIRRAAAIRQEPRVDSPVLLRLRPGAYLSLVDSARVNGYYHVEIPVTGYSGWVYRTLVRRYQGKKPNVE